jgi:hypothetical protein
VNTLAPSMLASFPASMLNQSQTDLGIPNRFNLTSSRSSKQAVLCADGERREALDKFRTPYQQHELYNDFNDVGVRSFVLSGAPDTIRTCDLHLRRATLSDCLE